MQSQQRFRDNVVQIPSILLIGSLLHVIEYVSAALTMGTARVLAHPKVWWCKIDPEMERWMHAGVVHTHVLLCTRMHTQSHMS